MNKFDLDNFEYLVHIFNLFNWSLFSYIISALSQVELAITSSNNSFSVAI